jgi:leucyl-tRNA synthetase
MFAAPPEQSLEWHEAGVEGMARFLRRFWREVQAHAGQPDHPRVDPADLTPAQKTLRRQLHAAIQKVGDDYGRRHSFNTAIAALMELLNHVSKFNDMSDQGRAVRHEALQAMVLLLNPVTPHVCHALWQALGHPEALLEDLPFPRADPAALERDSVTLAVQVNGKLRGTIEMAPDAPRELIEAAALADPGVARFIAGQVVRKVIVVPGKIVNIVVAAG